MIPLFFPHGGISQTKENRAIEQTAKLFLALVKKKFDLDKAILFGSYARHEAKEQSDMDIAILLHGKHGQRTETALEIAAIAFDVMLETGVLVDAVPFWKDEWRHPEQFKNPALIKNIQRDGIPL